MSQLRHSCLFYLTLSTKISGQASFSIIGKVILDDRSFEVMSNTSTAWSAHHPSHWTGYSSSSHPWHHGHKHSWARSHVGPILAVIISSLIVLGSLGVVIRTGASLWRGEGPAEVGEGTERVKMGGARRLRKMLVIGLLFSDAVIA
jgi:hypothetical protein